MSKKKIPYNSEYELILLFAMRINLRNVKFSKKNKINVIAPLL